LIAILRFRAELFTQICFFFWFLWKLSNAHLVETAA